MNILTQIVEKKRERVKESKRVFSVETLRGRAKGLSHPGMERFTGALRRINDRIRVIAELKKASPSAGLIRPDFNPLDLATDYVTAGCDAISVLTEQDFFQGSPDFLLSVREGFPDTPLLRKDFIFDYYQIVESAALGADAVLIIVALVRGTRLRDLITAARELNMAALVEVHSTEEAREAAAAGADIIGINNRNLITFLTDIRHTAEIIETIPDRQGKLIISESGINTRNDISYLLDLGVDAALIGERFMRTPKPGDAIRHLIYGENV